MSLLTVDRYRAITGDTDTSASTVSALVEDAVDLLVEDLGRELEEAERTETLWRDRAGWLWPSVTPVLSASGWTVEGDGLRPGGLTTPAAGLFDVLAGATVSVAYTGGYVERSANPDADNRLPACIERDLAWAAYALGHRVEMISTSVPAGAASIRLGDVAVTFASRGAGRSVTDMSVRWSRATLRYRR